MLINLKTISPSFSTPGRIDLGFNKIRPICQVNCGKCTGNYRTITNFYAYQTVCCESHFPRLIQQRPCRPCVACIHFFFRLNSVCFVCKRIQNLPSDVFGIPLTSTKNGELTNPILNNPYTVNPVETATLMFFSDDFCRHPKNLFQII